MRKIKKLSVLILIIVCLSSIFAFASCKKKTETPVEPTPTTAKFTLADFESENELYKYNYVDNFGTVEFNQDTKYIKNGQGSVHYLINGSPYDETQSYPPYLVLYMDEEHINKTNFTDVTAFHFDFYNNSDRNTTLNFRFHFGTEFTPKLPYTLEKGKWTSIDIPFARGAYNNVYNLEDVKWIEVIFENRLASQSKVSVYADNFYLETTTEKMEETPFRTGDNYLDVTEGSLAYWSTSYTGKIEVNKDKKFIKTGDISYKFYDKGTFDEGGGTNTAWPKIMLSNKVPSMDISSYDYFSMWVYNDSNRDVELMSFLNLNLAVANRKSWTLVRLPINAPSEVQNNPSHPDRQKYLSTMKDGADSKYDIKDFKSFNLFHVNNPIAEVNLYLDSIFLEKQDKVIDIDVEIPKVIPESFTIPMPMGVSTTVSVVDPNGKILDTTSGKVNASDYGVYSFNYSYSKDGKVGTKVYQSLFMAVRPDGIVDSFASSEEFNKNVSGADKGVVSFNNEFTKDNIGGSMKITGNDIIGANIINIPFLDFTNYGGLGFWVYNNKPTPTNVFLTQTGMANCHIGTAKENAWTYLTLEKSKFKLSVSYDLGFPNYDLTNITFIKFLFAEGQTGVGEIELYIDAIEMLEIGYLAPTLTLSKEADTSRINQAYLMPTALIVDDLDTSLQAVITYVSSFDSIIKTLNSNSFMPTEVGTYTFTYTVTDSNGNIVTATFVLEASTNAKPIIILDDAEDRIYLGGEYFIANSTITDDDGKDYVAKTTYSVNGGESITIINGKFIPMFEGTYVITYLVTDEEGLESTASYTIIVTNRTLLANFVTEKDVTDNFEAKSNSTATISNEITKDSIGGSIKISGGSNGIVEFKVNNLLITDLTNFGGISFWIYNSAPVNINAKNVMLSRAGAAHLHITTAHSKIWTKVMISKEQLHSMAPDFGLPTYDIANLDNINITLADWQGANHDIFVDSFEVFEIGEQGKIENFDNKFSDYVSTREGANVSYSEEHRRGEVGGALKVNSANGGTINIGVNAPIGEKTHIGFWAYNSSTELLGIFVGQSGQSNIFLGQWIKSNSWGYFVIDIEASKSNLYIANGIISNIELIVVGNLGNSALELYIDDMELVTKKTKTYLEKDTTTVNEGIVSVENAIVSANNANGVFIQATVGSFIMQIPEEARIITAITFEIFTNGTSSNIAFKNGETVLGSANGLGATGGWYGIGGDNAFVDKQLSPDDYMTLTVAVTKDSDFLFFIRDFAITYYI